MVSISWVSISRSRTVVHSLLSGTFLTQSPVRDVSVRAVFVGDLISKFFLLPCSVGGKYVLKTHAEGYEIFLRRRVGSGRRFCGWFSVDSSAVLACRQTPERDHHLRTVLPLVSSVCTSDRGTGIDSTIERLAVLNFVAQTGVESPGRGDQTPRYHPLSLH